MAELDFAPRDFAWAFGMSLPLGAVVASAVGAVISWAAPVMWLVVVVAAICGLFLGLSAAVGSLIGYYSARGLKLRTVWAFGAPVALGAGLAVLAILALVTLGEMGGFVSETIDGHPSNPWLDMVPGFAIGFVAASAVAYLWFVGFTRRRMRHPRPPRAAAESVI